MLEHRERSSNEKLAALDGKMEAVVGWAKAGYVDFSKFDFTPSPTLVIEHIFLLLLSFF